MGTIYKHVQIKLEFFQILNFVKLDFLKYGINLNIESKATNIVHSQVDIERALIYFFKLSILK